MKFLLILNELIKSSFVEPLQQLIPGLPRSIENLLNVRYSKLRQLLDIPAVFNSQLFAILINVQVMSQGAKALIVYPAYGTSHFGPIVFEIVLLVILEVVHMLGRVGPGASMSIPIGLKRNGLMAHFAGYPLAVIRLCFLRLATALALNFQTVMFKVGDEALNIGD